MKHFYSLPLMLVTMITLASCSDLFRINGSSNISSLDGRKMYLKVFKDNEFIDIDSCDIVHGKFSFSGKIDSATMANIFIDKEQVMPVVIENGVVEVDINDIKIEARGTELNERLYTFMRQYNMIVAERRDLIHRHDRGIIDGIDGSDMSLLMDVLQMEDVRLSLQEDSLVTRFITDNFDNPLGPGIFFLTTVGFDYPLLTPWVEDIMSKATTRFKNDTYVKAYYEKAHENQQIMNGLKDTHNPYGVSPMVKASDINNVPTPNQLAK